MATRHRGRRPAPDERKVRQHQKIITATQQRRIDLRRELDELDAQLGQEIDDAIKDSVATNAIGSWLASPERPNGISRQMVYKLLPPSTNGKTKAKPRSPRKRPGQKGGSA